MRMAAPAYVLIVISGERRSRSAALFADDEFAAVVPEKSPNLVRDVSGSRLDA